MVGNAQIFTLQRYYHIFHPAISIVTNKLPIIKTIIHKTGNLHPKNMPIFKICNQFIPLPLHDDTKAVLPMVSQDKRK